VRQTDPGGGRDDQTVGLDNKRGGDTQMDVARREWMARQMDVGEKDGSDRQLLNESVVLH
jgi:hypothetical protein